MEEELTREALAVDGEIPASLSGRYLRNGPNPALPPDPARRVTWPGLAPKSGWWPGASRTCCRHGGRRWSSGSRARRCSSGTRPWPGLRPRQARGCCSCARCRNWPTACSARGCNRWAWPIGVRGHWYGQARCRSIADGCRKAWTRRGRLRLRPRKFPAASVRTGIGRRGRHRLPVLQQPQHDRLLAHVVGADVGLDQPRHAVEEAAAKHVAAPEAPCRRQHQPGRRGALAAGELVLGHHPRIALLLLEQLQERAIGIVQQVARQQCDRAVHRDRFVDFAIAPESAAATVEQPQYPVRIGGAVAQEAAVVLGQAREAIARCARETGGAFGFDRLAQ